MNAVTDFEQSGKAVEAFSDAITDAVMSITDQPRFKDAKQRLIDELWDEIQYSVIDRMPEQIEWFIRDMASKVVELILRGDEGGMRRYLGCDGYTGRDKRHEVIRGRLFETGALELRKHIAQQHADLIQNERIKDLKSQVASLVEQINAKDARLESLFERLRSCE